MKLNIVSHPKCKIYQEWAEYLPGQTQLSILDITEITNVQEYIANCMNPTARNRYRFSCRNYITRLMHYNSFIESIWEINTSAPVRQNSPMRENYTQKPAPLSAKLFTCEKHYYRHFGCFTREDHKLVAYATVHISGELCAVTQIIGHAQYLKDDIMLNLFAAVVEFAISAGAKGILYSRWTDGTDGLRHWKYSVGFRCDTVELINN